MKLIKGMLIITVLFMVGCSGDNIDDNKVEEKKEVVTTEEVKIKDLKDVIQFFSEDAKSYSATIESTYKEIVAEDGQSIGSIDSYVYDSKNDVLRKKTELIFKEGDPYANYFNSEKEPSTYYDLEARTMHIIMGNLDLRQEYVSSEFNYPVGPFEWIASYFKDFSDKMEYTVEETENHIIYNITNMTDIYNGALDSGPTQEQIENFTNSSNNNNENDEKNVEVKEQVETTHPVVEERFLDVKVVLVFDKEYNILSITESYVDVFGIETGPLTSSMEMEFKDQEELTIPKVWTGEKEE